MKQFNFENDNAYAEYVASQANIILDKCDIYGDEDDRKGLMTNVENSIEAKKWLENIFKMHPGYNGKGQIILPIEVERPIVEDNIYDYARYIEEIGRKYLLEEACIDGYTYNEAYSERESLYRYVRGVEYMRLTDDEVTIKGKPFTEWREQYEKFVHICNTFDNPTYYYIGDGKYVLRESKEKLNKVGIISRAIRNCIGKNLEKEEDIQNLSEAFPHSQAKVGIKITRVIQKCLKELGLWQLATEKEKETFNREYAKWCDSVSPLKVKKWLVISINFVDYLTMSCGNSWTSCLNIDKCRNFTSGMWSEGFNSRRVLDYALDPSTIVLYTIDENYNGDDYELQPKNTRQLFHFGEYKLVQARLYPQDKVARRNIYTQYREVMEKVIADSLGEANLWSAPERGEIEYDGSIVNIPYEYSGNGSFIDFLDIASHGEYERDFQEEVNYVIFRGSTNRCDNGVPMTVGSTDAVCIMCGEKLTENHHNAIACGSCY